MNKRKAWLIITAEVVGLVFGTVGWAQETPYYHNDRTFVPVEFNLQGTPTVDQLFTETEKLTETVKGDPVKIDTNGTYAIERQGGYCSGL